MNYNRIIKAILILIIINYNYQYSNYDR